MVEYYVIKVKEIDGILRALYHSTRLKDFKNEPKVDNYGLISNSCYDTCFQYATGDKERDLKVGLNILKYTLVKHEQEDIEDYKEKIRRSEYRINEIKKIECVELIEDVKAEAKKEMGE